MPLPRFWYFPRDEEAVIVMTGDDHASGGTAGRFDSQAAQSPPGCSVADWECIRSTSYIYTNTPLTDAQAAAYDAQGFEVGLHVDTNCANWTPAQLESFFSTQLAAWQAKYASLPSPVSNRTHCISWSDWASHPKTELAHGIRFDTNYYYWPPDWIQNRPGMFTGSGMPMRFADLDGTVIDVYQGATQMTDESGQTYPFTVDALLDRAPAPRASTARSSRTCTPTAQSSAGEAAIVSSALAHGVPVVSSRQMLTWLDGRNASSFGSLAYSGGTMSFTIAPGVGANGLRALIPASTPDGPITGLTRDGSPVPFTVEVVKGIEYARFDAAAGSYEATYVADTTGPVITDVQADPNGDTAVVTWTTDELSSSRVDYGTNPGSLTSSATSPGMTTSHSVTLAGLAAATTYHYRVTSIDASGNSTTEPTGTPLSFTTSLAKVVDTTAADFGAGTLGSRYVPRPGWGRRGRACTDRGERVRWLVPAGGLDERTLERRRCVDSGERDRHRRRLAARDRLVLRARPCARVRGGHRRRGVPARRARNRPERPALGVDLLVRRERRPVRTHEQRDRDEHADHGLDRPDAQLPHRVDRLRARLLRGRCACRDASDADRGEPAPGRQRHLRQCEHRQGRLAAAQPVRLDGHVHVARARRRK